MHIILAVLGAIGAAIWAFIHFTRAANEGREAVSEVKGAVRRAKWSREVDSRLIENIADPREAAAVLMAQIASYDGEITSQQKDRMKELMGQHFGADNETSEGLYSFGRMAIGQINDAANSLRKLLRPIMDALTLDEMKEFVTMLEEMAEVEGAPTDRQRQLISEVRRVLSLTTVG